MTRLRRIIWQLTPWALLIVGAVLALYALAYGERPSVSS